MLITPGGEPFFFKGSEVGCLLVHGFPGTPLEMRWLGEALHRQGFSVLGVRLFGHATEPADLMRVRARDWLANIEDGSHLLKNHCSRLILIGFSLGAVLSASITSTIEFNGLVLMAMPMDLPRLTYRLRPFLPLLKYLWRYRNPPDESDWYDKQAEALNLDYPVQPINAVGHIFDLIQDLPGRLATLSIPTLLIYSEDDASVPTDHGKLAYEIIPSKTKELVLIEGSGHSLVRDAQRELVFHQVGTFAKKVGGASG